MTGRLHHRRRRCARFSRCDAGRDVDGRGACMRQPPRSIAAAVDMRSACAACSSRRALCFSPDCHRYDELRCGRSRCSMSCVCGCDSSVRPRISAVFFSGENCRAVARARRSDVARRLARAHRGLAGETAAQWTNRCYLRRLRSGERAMDCCSRRQRRGTCFSDIGPPGQPHASSCYRH